MISSDPRAILYEPRVVWQVDLHSKRGLDDYDLGLDYIYSVRADPGGRPSVTLVLDESKHSAPTVPRPLLARIVFSGMGRGIGVWAFTQSRFKIYPNLFSDATSIICFRVQSQRDRAVIEGDLGVPCEELAGLGDHEFVVFRQGDSAWAGPMKLPKPKV